MAKDAMEVQGICLKALRSASESEAINPMVAVVGWDKAVKHERTARGLAGDVQELRHADPDGKPLRPERTPDEEATRLAMVLNVLARTGLAPPGSAPAGADPEAE